MIIAIAAIVLAGIAGYLLGVSRVRPVIHVDAPEFPDFEPHFASLQQQVGVFGELLMRLQPVDLRPVLDAIERSQAPAQPTEIVHTELADPAKINARHHRH